MDLCGCEDQYSAIHMTHDSLFSHNCSLWYAHFERSLKVDLTVKNVILLSNLE